MRGKKSSSPFLLYFHGGGWLTRFRGSDFDWLARLAKTLHIPILYVDYSLAPDRVYPDAIEECFQVYQYVRNGKLQVQPTKIFLAGDSSGGNLATAVTLRCILTDIQKPDALFLAYPMLSFKSTLTPSRFLFMMDPVLPMNLPVQAKAVYLPSHCDSDLDPFISPLAASPQLLAQFPPVSIMTGSFDPLLDDSVDFVHKLHAQGVPCRFKVFKALPHAFLNLTHLLTGAWEATELLAEWIQLELQRP
jgi:acetyl esterase